MWKVPARRFLMFTLLMAGPAPAWALCCPGDIRDMKPANSGMGQSQPAITDLSLDSEWRVHAFERDGISYFQVGDALGTPQFIVGKAGSYFWMLPAGMIDVQIKLPNDDHRQPQLAGLREVLRHPDFTLLVNGSGKTASWSVVAAADAL